MNAKEKGTERKEVRGNRRKGRGGKDKGKPRGEKAGESRRTDGAGRCGLGPASWALPRDLLLFHGALQEKPPASFPASGSLQQPRVQARTASAAVSLEQRRQPAWHCRRRCISGGSLGKSPPTVPTDPSTFPAKQDPNKFLGADSLANSSALPISRQGGSARGLHTEGMHHMGSGRPGMAEGLRPTWL